MFKVRKTQCSTCIYRPESPLADKLPKLEAAVCDEHGHYNGWRICHSSQSSCCRGFYDRHGDNCTHVQIAQRLGLIFFTNTKTGGVMFRPGSHLQVLFEVFLSAPERWLTSGEAVVVLNQLRERGELDHYRFYTHVVSPMLKYLYDRGALERINIGTDTAKRYSYRLHPSRRGGHE